MDRLDISVTHTANPTGCGTVNASAPPPVPAVPRARPSRRSCAGFWRRFVAFLVDAAILALPIWLGRALIGWIHYRALANIILDAGGVTASRLDAATSLARLVFSLCLPLVYFVLFEASSRAGTPGKRFLGFQVKTTAGGKAGLGRILLRNLFKLLSALPLMAGFVLALVTPRRRTLHDLLSGSLMVKTRSITVPGNSAIPPPV